jgi:hypothetical protein
MQCSLRALKIARNAGKRIRRMIFKGIFINPNFFGIRRSENFKALNLCSKLSFNCLPSPI